MSIVTLDQVNKDQVDVAGGKGANLGELIASGFPVPPGFVVTADCYATFVSDFKLPANDDLPGDTAAWLSALRQRMLNTPLSPSLSIAIQQAHEALMTRRGKDILYAIRSSATAEDRADASFAGQHETYYYVEAPQLDTMIRKCWASLWSEEAFSYRQSQAIEHRSVRMAVVAQEMVRSDISGITFTADPVSGSDTVIVTESCWGMGAAIVDGRVSPDQYIVDKSNQKLTAIKISNKKFMVPASLAPNQTSRLQEVPAELKNKESLQEHHIERITALALQAEQHFGCPQDIEWAIHNDELFFLQSRPITVLGEQLPQVPPGRYVLFKSMAENFTDPLSPLTQDLLKDLVPMIKMIHGRAYIPFNLVRPLVPFKLSDEDVARLAYLSEPAAKPKISMPRSLFLALILLGNYLMMAVFNRRTANMPDDFMDGFRDHIEAIVEDDSISAAETMMHAFARYRFFEPAGHMVLLVNLVAPRYIFTMGILKSLLARWCPNLPAETASLLCAGTDGILSKEMGQRILGLAEVARQDPALRQIITTKPLSDLESRLRASPSASELVGALDSFLAKHGHRAIKEFEFNSPRWEEDPGPILGMVRNYLLVDSDPADSESRIRKQRLRVQADVAAALARHTPPLLRLIRQSVVNQLVRQTQYYMKLRENSRFFHIMAFYAVRRKIQKIEASLLERGLLKCRDDIFYLHWHEVSDLNDEKLGWSDVEDLIRGRRMEYIRLSKITPQKTVGIEIDSPAPESSDSLSGQGASPGRYEGIARVIMDPATNSEIAPGEILVAPFTDPAWTPLFLTASAAVVEVGSYLSHAGTIAREYGMPCVVDVANCTSKITSGSRIVVDGTQGSVTLLEEDGNA